MVAFAPGVISTKVFGDITIGIIIGVAIILASIVLTGRPLMKDRGALPSDASEARPEVAFAPSPGCPCRGHEQET
jgi:uncharacterized membrane protein (DUF485 family)